MDGSHQTPDGPLESSDPQRITIEDAPMPDATIEEQRAEAQAPESSKTNGDKSRLVFEHYEPNSNSNPDVLEDVEMG